MELLVLLVALTVLALTASRWGADSRASRGWSDGRFAPFPPPADRR